jgi:Flp pilus assembly protein protease CpaA
MLLPILLLALAVVVSLYDLKKGKVPNWVTLPLLAVGIVAHFPGAASTWMICLILFTAWHAGWIAAGDAKLWMALVWLLPGSTPLMIFATFFATSLLQLILRKLKCQPLTGIRSPGAWRAIPFLLWSLYVH